MPTDVSPAEPADTSSVESTPKSAPDSTDAPTRTPATLQNSATWALAQLDSAIRSNVNAALARTKIESLSLRGYWLLEAIDTNAGIAQTELSDILHMDRSDMVRLIDTLENAGLVTRTRDSNDRRRQLIMLSDAGVSTRQSLRRSIRRAEKAAVAHSQAHVLEALSTLLTRVETITEEATTEPATELDKEPMPEQEPGSAQKTEQLGPEPEKPKKKPKKKKKKKKKKDAAK